MGAPEPGFGRAAEVASRLIGTPVDEIGRVGGGRNSRVFRVRAGGTTYALKQYPSRADDPRDRLGTEAMALTLMDRHGLTRVPRLLATDRDQDYALLSWLDGQPPGTITEADIDASAAFLAAIHTLRAESGFPAERLASEACLSAAESLRQIDARRALLAGLPDEIDLHRFLAGPFATALDRASGAAADRLAAVGLDLTAVLPQDRRSLVPSDFGFHNSLRRTDGSLAFFDFEYFGWDDPAKLTADFMLHPGTPLNPEQRHRIGAAARSVYGDTPQFAERLEATYPLYGLRWVLILLNEFLPDRWRRRQAAGAATSWDEAKARQLAHARRLLDHVARTIGGRDGVNVLAMEKPQPAALDERSRYLRRLIVRGLDKGQRGHVGSSMSLVEIMRVLYDDVLRYRPDDPKWSGRDRMILSKGHGCLAQYVLLADKGFIPLETIDTFCHRDSILGGHPESAKIPGVEASTGALGHGLSIGVGMALAARMARRDSRVFVVMGDGEINEGSVWEAALCAGKHRLSGLTAMIDYNKIQSAGTTREIQDLEPLADKWRAFGFAVAEVDGHDVGALRELLLSMPLDDARPTAIICHTIKGKGIPFAENDPNWHHKAKLARDVIDRMYAALE